MRKGEEIVMEAVCKHFGALRWEPMQKDPPDALLVFRDSTIKVEISTLSEQVLDERGSLQPRRSDDESALGLADELNNDPDISIPDRTILFLYISSPINARRKTAPLLKSKILEFMKSSNRTTQETIRKNDITMKKVKTLKSATRKIVAFVINRRPNQSGIRSENRIPKGIADRLVNREILLNACEVLRKVIEKKTHDCRNLDYRDPVWLALGNDYELAGLEIYKEALRKLNVGHPFWKILMVDREGLVHVIYENIKSRP